MGDSTAMEPTGERTVPGIDREQYFFARHRAVYRWVADSWLPHLRERVVDAGSGEGYGAALLADAGADLVLGLEYDDHTASHAARTYPGVSIARANLAEMPLRVESIDLVVCLQVIEHLWDLPGFLRKVREVLRPHGAVIASTPNREVFSPGLNRGEKPLNPFHVEEFDAGQLDDLFRAGGWTTVEVLGLHHGERITAWEGEHGSVMQAQIDAMTTGHWPEALADFIPTVTDDDFLIEPTTLHAQDLIVIGRRL